MRQGHVYAPHGLLALDPKAYGMYVEALPVPQVVDARASVAVVTIRGPLDHHPQYWGDSYDRILERCATALSASPKALVLSIDSPGGLVSGMLDTSRSLRSMARGADVPLYVFVDGAATSAAYALASAADRIFVSRTSLLGSIGVMDAVVDQSAANEKYGVRISLVASGDRKLDGNPNAPTSDAALVTIQKRVEALAEAFFDLVAEHRPVEADAIRALEGAIVLGDEAVRLGLADQLGTFEDLLALASGERPASAASKDDDTMDKTEDEARKALQAMADDDDADDKAKARARAALKAMDEDDDAGDDKDDKKDADAKEGDDTDDKKDEEAKALSAATGTALATTMQAMGTRLAKLEAEKEDAERTKIFVARPDLSPDLVKALASSPVDEVKTIVDAIKAPPASHPAAASGTVGATRGAGQGAGTPGDLPADQALAMDQAMGLANTKTGVKREGTVLFLGASVPVTPAADKAAS